MGFGEAISSAFANYFNFSGRATRPAYWYFILFYVIVAIVAAVIDATVLGAKGVGVLSGLFGLAALIPSLAVLVRRLHDTGRSGWFVLLGLIPLIGGIILLIWVCQRGEAVANRFGPPMTA
jgi:uncharacterized membrane protein YhaH (DUF805 family)